MNLVKLYTIHGPLWVDTGQFNQSWRRCLTIYTSHGNRAEFTAKTEADRQRVMWGVHRDNLFASRQLAEAQYQRITADMVRRSKEAASEYRAGDPARTEETI